MLYGTILVAFLQVVVLPGGTTGVGRPAAEPRPGGTIAQAEPRGAPPSNPHFGPQYCQQQDRVGSRLRRQPSCRRPTTDAASHNADGPQETNAPRGQATDPPAAN